MKRKREGDLKEDYTNVQQTVTEEMIDPSDSQSAYASGGAYYKTLEYRLCIERLKREF